MKVISGSINRKVFLIASIIIVAADKLTLFLLDYYSKYIHGDAIFHLILMSITDFLCLLIFTLFAVKRLRDSGISSLWVLVFWLLLPYTVENIILINLEWGFDYQPFFIPAILVTLTAVILFIVLLLKPGNHGQSLSSTPDQVHG